MLDRIDIFPRPPGQDTLRLHGLRSLQFKGALLIVLVVLAVSMTMVALSLYAARTALMEREKHRAQEWAVSLATGTAESVALRDREALQRSANSIIRMHGVACVVFADLRGQVLASAEAHAGLPPGLGSPEQCPDGRLTSECLERPEINRLDRLGITYVDVIVPIRLPSANAQDATAPAKLAGYLRFATDISDARAKLLATAAELGRIVVIALLLVVPISLLATRRVVAPLYQLARVAHALANGAWDVRAHVHSRDETGELARTFNFMADQVSRTQTELRDLNKELERRVAERTRDLEEQAARDPLTGIYNRRHFGEVITREFSAAERYEHDLTCLMFDVDHFKTINDRYGHRTGDKVLIALAQAISAELRSSDVAARFGGDEFILLLPQTAATQAAVLADRIVDGFCKQIATAVPGVAATLSIGVASLLNTRSRSSEALIHEADVALYAAKEGGRNRTMQAVGAN
jgi:diguanylate cyclase (GGDEF)-like protein